MSEEEPGEGNRAAARAYNRAAHEYAQHGDIEGAAREARRAIEDAPRAHQQAEAAGRARARGFDPQLREQPAPSRWERVREAVRRDWEQTLHDLTAHQGGDDLDQSALDTLLQMLGRRELPAPDEPTGVPREPQIAERAQRFGYEAASVYTGPWTEEVNEAMQAHWNHLGPRSSWDIYRPLVVHGWWYRRERQRVPPT